MKNTRLIFMGLALALATSALFGSCSRSSITPSQRPSQQIVGKWTVQNAISHTIVMGDELNDTIAFGAPNYFQFNADSTLNIMMDNVPYNGSWRITDARLYIMGTGYLDVQNGYPRGFTLPILTQASLQLNYKDTTNVAVLEQKLNLNR